MRRCFAAAVVYSRVHSASSRAQYVTIISAPARLSEVMISSTAARSSRNPFSPAAVIMAYLPLTRHVAGRNHVGTGGGVRQCCFYQKLDRLIVQHMEMIAINSCHPAVTVTHVFAQTDVGNCDKLGTFVFDRTERLLHDTIFGISAARLLIFFLRNSENKHGLQSELLRALCFVDNLANGKLKDTRHARNRPPFFDLLA